MSDEVIQSRHYLANCGLCGEMVICADCGNNCCNACTGQINGVNCGCDEAYAHQDIFWKNKSAIVFVTQTPLEVQK